MRKQNRSRSKRLRFSRPRSGSGSSTGSTGSSGCVNKKHIKKYANRPSPPFPANSCCNQEMIGNDGKMYKSVADKNGVCKWKKIK